MATEKQAQNEVAKAKDELSSFRDAAKSELEAFPMLHKFEMSGECEDKNGELTRVLELDFDAEGIIGVFMEVGQPYEFVFDKDAAPDDRIKKSDAKLKRFIDVIANVDLSDSKVQKAIGWTAAAAARSKIDSFFTLRLVVDTPFELGTES